jgi:hypothetical protein
MPAAAETVPAVLQSILKCPHEPSRPFGSQKSDWRAAVSQTGIFETAELKEPCT